MRVVGKNAQFSGFGCLVEVRATVFFGNGSQTTVSLPFFAVPSSSSSEEIPNL
jgi:hypothetical protein